MRGRWWLTAAGVLVFSSNSALAKPIKSAVTAIGQYFDDIGSSIDDGDAIEEAVRGARVQAAMKTIIAHARAQGFLTAAKHSKKQMPVFYGSRIRNTAENRAKKVNRWMKRTTQRVLTNAPDSAHVLSKERALMAAQYEAGRSYFRGVADGFRGTGFKKRWITSSEDPCPDCQDNEDVGAIGVDEEFPSGDLYPLAHQHCACMIAIAKK